MISIFLLIVLYFNDAGNLVIRQDTFDTQAACEDSIPGSLVGLSESDLQTISISCTEHKIGGLS